MIFPFRRILCYGSESARFLKLDKILATCGINYNNRAVFY